MSNPFSFDHWADAASVLRERGEGYVLVTVLTVKGSAPRDAGTKMLVSADRTVNTIGGGQLEHDAIKTARAMLHEKRDQQKLEDYPLGPKLGQCCGGRVNLLYECFAPSAVQIALFGAGHVGRALVTVLAQLPVQLIWIDSRAEEFPDPIADSVQVRISDDPETEVATLNPGAYVAVMTHNHPLDYAIAEAALKRNDLAYVGVIGSETKSKRFRKRLKYWGFPAAVIEQLHCPIGLDAVPGKHPMEVAVSVAAEIIGLYQKRQHQGLLPHQKALPKPGQPIIEKPTLENGDSES